MPNQDTNDFTEKLYFKFYLEDYEAEAMQKIGEKLLSIKNFVKTYEDIDWNELSPDVEQERKVGMETALEVSMKELLKDIDKFLGTKSSLYMTEFSD